MWALLTLLATTGAQQFRADTVYGPVLGGLRTTATTGSDYVSFQGLPYASPPVGPLRLRPPL